MCCIYMHRIFIPTRHTVCDECVCVHMYVGHNGVCTCTCMCFSKMLAKFPTETTLTVHTTCIDNSLQPEHWKHSLYEPLW